MYILHQFQTPRPRYETPQAKLLEQLEAALQNITPEQAKELVRRHGCKPKYIEKRGHETPGHTSEMKLSEKMKFFTEHTLGVLRTLYAQTSQAPDSITHVTCTGYHSPSSAQLLVAEKKWHQNTRVTHAYHMGCYAAFPALRMTMGDLARQPARAGLSADIVHTELCSLHFNPKLHAPENIVIQSLFSDGFVKYSVTREEEASALVGPRFQVLDVHEELIPDSSQLMTWFPHEDGFAMTLSREIPRQIGANFPKFIKTLVNRAGVNDEAAQAIFAIHPGGPRILDEIQRLLRLEDPQLRFSRAVLRECGNMSSATVPTIWSRVLDDASVPAGTLVLSFAFGPGLTVCGSVLRKLG